MSKRKSESKKRRYKRAAIIEKHKKRALETLEVYCEEYNLPKGEFEILEKNMFISLYQDIYPTFTIENKLNGDLFLCISTITDSPKAFEWLEIIKVKHISLGSRDPDEYPVNGLEWHSFI